MACFNVQPLHTLNPEMLKPLTVEVEVEYDIDRSLFPGLDNPKLPPALMIKVQEEFIDLTLDDDEDEILQTNASSSSSPERKTDSDDNDIVSLIDSLHSDYHTDKDSSVEGVDTIVEFLKDKSPEPPEKPSNTYSPSVSWSNDHLLSVVSPPQDHSTPNNGCLLKRRQSFRQSKRFSQRPCVNKQLSFTPTVDECQLPRSSNVVDTSVDLGFSNLSCASVTHTESFTLKNVTNNSNTSCDFRTVHDQLVPGHCDSFNNVPNNFLADTYLYPDNIHGDKENRLAYVEGERRNTDISLQNVLSQIVPRDRNNYHDSVNCHKFSVSNSQNYMAQSRFHPFRRSRYATIRAH